MIFSLFLSLLPDLGELTNRLPRCARRVILVQMRDVTRARDYRERELGTPPGADKLYHARE